jgi:GT2 family glycosyltransferase
VLEHAPTGTEILVIDDASPWEALRPITGDFPSVRVLRLPRRRGFCYAASIGIHAANSPIVELLNDDTEVSAGWAEAALAHFRHPNVVAVAPLILQHPQGESPYSISHAYIDSAGDEYDPGGYAWKRGHGLRWSDQLPLQLRQVGPVTSASGCAAFYRREAIRAAGGLAISFGAYFEDVDLGLRLRQRGGQILFEPASVVWHYGSASYGRAPRRPLLEQQSCNEERLFWRHWQHYGGWRLLPRHVAVLIGKICRRCCEGQLLPWTFGRLRAWGELMIERS